MKFSSCLVMVFALALVAMGCSGDDGSGIGELDITPPSVTVVTPIDINHIEIEFDETLNKSSAERNENYTIVEQAISPSPVTSGDDVPYLAAGDTVRARSAILDSDGRTVILTTEQQMGSVPYELSVRGVQDDSGNKITTDVTSSFNGIDTPDVTPPTIVFRSPSNGSTNVGTRQSVVVQFSEPMLYQTILESFSWTHTGGSVSFIMQERGENTYEFEPNNDLTLNTDYSVAFAGARDLAGNQAATTSWDFRTLAIADNTPPYLQSSYPADGTVNVPTDAILRMTFSEPVRDEFDGIIVTPWIGDGIGDFSQDGRTATFDPFEPLLENTQYTITMPPGSVEDLSGNGIESITTITFTTGPALAAGRFTGTISGDPLSVDARSAAGAIVLALDAPLDAGEGFGVAGSGVVGSGGQYTIRYLGDGTYWPLAILDSNGDGEYEPDTGDAVGAYGFNITQGQTEFIPVNIEGGGSVTSVDFPLFDQVAIVGSVHYDGSQFAGQNLRFYVGVFDTTGFDTTLGIPEPVTGTEGSYIFESPEYAVSFFGHGLPDGTYYVGAFLDSDWDGIYDEGIDPGGFYQVGGHIAAVTVANGRDALDVQIVLVDPDGGPALSSRWRAGHRPAGRLGSVAVSHLRELFPGR